LHERQLNLIDIDITAGTLVQAVLSATSQSNGNGQTSTHHRIQTP